MKKKVLDVGQCDFDHWALKQMVESFRVKLIRVHSIYDAIEMLRKEPVALVLVNRIIDRDGSEGIRLIEEMQSDAALRTIPVMLISNYEDSQHQAVEKGAVRGFGKKELRSELTREKLSRFLS
ncbi:MAG: hypothetical protein MRJ65_12780 [Candidatus Brocadiaceae bacterium]|nr:hypothetical protein [Candidatus Brocadiaceae bacterium]